MSERSERKESCLLPAVAILMMIAFVVAVVSPASRNTAVHWLSTSGVDYASQFAARASYLARGWVVKFQQLEPNLQIFIYVAGLYLVFSTILYVRLNLVNHRLKQLTKRLPVDADRLLDQLREDVGGIRRLLCDFSRESRGQIDALSNHVSKRFDTYLDLRDSRENLASAVPSKSLNTVLPNTGISAMRDVSIRQLEIFKALFEQLCHCMPDLLESAGDAFLEPNNSDDDDDDEEEDDA